MFSLSCVMNSVTRIAHQFKLDWLKNRLEKLEIRKPPQKIQFEYLSEKGDQAVCIYVYKKYLLDQKVVGSPLITTPARL